VDNHLYEKSLSEKGFKFIAGVDEVGRGSLAGPVLAAAVILPFPCNIEGIKDSKKLTPKRREELSRVILGEAIAYSFGIVESDEIDKINILQATLKAMRIAVDLLSVQADHILVDGSQAISTSIPQLVIPKGDSKSISVAAASIIAKVKRDGLISGLEQKYSGFSFSVHKGYGTKLHLEEIKTHGPTPIHRKTFRGVR
jgi:ribonuclease HII